jgi:predicted nucleic acid-binding protein
MTFEASVHFGWSSKIVQRLRQNPTAIQQLDKFRQALALIPNLGIRVLTIPDSLIEEAAAVSKQCGLLSNDALIVAVMQQHGLTHLASHDTDFDRVPTLTRYAPA